MQVVKYIQKQYPATINEMKFTPSIGELKKDFESEVILRDEIMKIAASYLSLNIKSKSINSDTGLMLVVDFILEECSNLELQEINFIFRSGVMGKFGVIYNDISIDTICGKEGWIETYYKDFRKLRKIESNLNYDDLLIQIQRLKESKASQHIIDEYESKLKLCANSPQKNALKLTGKEMTLEDFHAKNPEYKLKYDLHGIYDRAKRFKTTIEDAKQFYLIKGLSLDDFKDDFQFYSKEYQNQELIKGEMLYITERFRKFIVENVFKNKK